jgi:hypothetical protein
MKSGLMDFLRGIAEKEGTVTKEDIEGFFESKKRG